MLDNLLLLDGNILLFIQNNIRTQWLNPVMKFITSLGDMGFVWLVTSVIFLLFKKTRVIGVLGIVTLVIDVGVNNVVIKNIVQRPRPFTQVENLVCIIKEPLDASFPSSHTGSSIAASLVFFKKLPGRKGVAFIVLGVLISLSRLYVGVHYPSDVLFGAFTGFIIYYVTLKMENLITCILDKFGILKFDILGFGGIKK